MKNKIDKNIISLWILRRSILMFFLLIITVVSAIFTIKENFFIYIIVPMLFIDLLWGLYSYAFPFLQYRNFSYELHEDSITVNYGVIFRTSFIIPFVQVQDISSHQGPMQIIFKIKTIILSTAGSNHFLLGLNNEVADKLLIDIKNYVHTLVLKEKE